MALAVLALGALLFAASAFTTLFRRTHIPDVLLLIVLGVLAGPVLKWVSLEDFGKIGSLMSSVALVVILFESGLSLELHTLARAARPATVLTIVTFLVTVGIVAAVARYAIGIPWTLASALGAFLGGTSSAIVIPMVKHLAMSAVPATVLIVESAITDVLCIIVALAFLDAAASGTPEPMRILGGVLSSFTLAVVVGVGAAMVFLFFINALRTLPNAVLTLLAFVFVTYGVAELLGFSGAIAALALGFTLTNRSALGITRLRFFSHVSEVKTPRYVRLFLEDLVFVLKTFFFVYLGLSIRFATVDLVAWAAVTVVVVWLARALIVRFTAPPETTPRDAAIMSVMVPKGLAAAVLAGIPIQRGFDAGPEIQQFTYMVVLIGIVVTSVLVPLVQRDVIKRWFGWANRAAA